MAKNNELHKSLMEDVYDFEDLDKKNTQKTPENKKTEEIKTKKEPTVNIYKNIAFSFIFLTIILVIFVAYFLFAKTVITVTPNKEIFTINFETRLNSSSTNGIIQEISLNDNQEFKSTGKKDLKKTIVGNVKLINNNNQVQPLVATTRLLSPEGKLFRIKNTVSVPAGGSIEAPIYTDTPSNEMALNETRFTIPGLWAGLQDKIYAVNEKPFEYKEDGTYFIVQKDITDATTQARKLLEDKLKAEIDKTYANYDQIAYQINPETFQTEINVKDGDLKEIFNLPISGKAVVAAFTSNSLDSQIKEAFSRSMGGEKTVKEIHYNDISWKIEDINIADGTATAKAEITADVLAKNGNIIDKTKITDLTEDELVSYLNSLTSVASYQIQFVPSFIRKTPSISDKIEVTVQQP